MFRVPRFNNVQQNRILVLKLVSIGIGLMRNNVLVMHWKEHQKIVEIHRTLFSPAIEEVLINHGSNLELITFLFNCKVSVKLVISTRGNHFNG